MACSLNCFCCCRGMQSTGITIGVFRLIYSLCMIGLAIKWIILGIDIMNDSHTTNQSKSEEIVRISVLGVIIVTYLIDFIVSIVLIIGICLRRHHLLFVWLVASFITTLIATLISLFVTISVIDSIILVNTGIMVIFYLLIFSLYISIRNGPSNDSFSPLLTSESNNYGSVGSDYSD